MSTEQPSQGLSQRNESDPTFSAAQKAKWGEIGISAVAAAAHQTSEKRQAELNKANGAPQRIVTLRDIDYFAA